MIAEYISMYLLSFLRRFETNGETSLPLKNSRKEKDVAHRRLYMIYAEIVSFAEVFFWNGKDTRNSRWSAQPVEKFFPDYSRVQ